MFRKISDKLFIMKQKSALLKEKKRLEDELKIVGKFPKLGDSEEDNSQEVEAFEGYKGLETGMRNLHKEVVKALAKMNKDEYGVCSVCKGPIEKGRQEAFPAATTCVEHSNSKK